MKILCSLSGVEFQTRDFFDVRISTTGLHPMMSQPINVLVSRAKDWSLGKLSNAECRILFIALLNSTKLIEFRTQATPTNGTIQLFMEPLLKTVGWIGTINSDMLLLPKFVVNHATRDLRGIGAWLETLAESKDDWINANSRNARARHHLQKQLQREEALSRLIKSYTKKSEDYAWRLAAWAMIAADVPKELHELWTSLFKLKGPAIYLANTADLEELVEHMENELPHGTIYANATLKHVRTLLAKNRSGDFGLGITLGTDLEAASASPYTFIEDAVETHNKEVAIADAPTREPLPHMYANKIDYIRDKAKWTLLQASLKKDDEFEQKVELANKLDDLTAIRDGEADDDAELDALLREEGINNGNSKIGEL